MLRRYIHTTTMNNAVKSAGCLIIGDEVLNGKIMDTNSYFFTKFCFNRLQIPVKKIIVCGDDKQDIKNSLSALIQDQCDFIVTSGGIGPTHDDITYESIGDTFELPCKLDKETVDRMNNLRTDIVSKLSGRKLDAFYKMATFPVDATNTIKVDKIYTDDSLWVPIIGIQQQVYILPGVPQLFEKLLNSLEAHIKPRIDTATHLKRCYVKTTTKESELAPFLTDLQQSCDDRYGLGTVKLGSYPHMKWSINTISIIANQDVKDEDIRELVSGIIEGIEGDAEEISIEQENLMTTTDPTN